MGLGSAILTGANATVNGVSKALNLPPVQAYFIARGAADAITAETKQQQTAALVGFGGISVATAAAAALSLGAISAPVVVPTVALVVAGYGARYATQQRNASSHYNLDEIFNPSDTKRHMVGLASQLFRAELADPKTGSIDWKNTDTLNKYATLLTRRIHALEEGIKANDSYLPDGIRALWSTGMDAVTNQESRKSDLKIAQAAHAELQSQMNGMIEYRKYEAAALAAQLCITNGVKRDITLNDLDVDNNGVLSASDEAELRRKINNETQAQLLLDKVKAQKINGVQINFNNQPLALFHAPQGQQLQPSPSLPDLAQAMPQQQISGTPRVDAPEQPSFFASLGTMISNFFSSIGSAIASLWSSPAEAPIANNAGGTNQSVQGNFPRSNEAAMEFIPSPTPVTTQRTTALGKS